MASFVCMNKLKETITSKSKIICVNNSLQKCCCNKRRQKNYRGKRFPLFRNGDYQNLFNQQTFLKNNKVLNAWSFISSPFWKLLEGGRLPVGVLNSETVRNLKFILSELVFS